MSTKEIPDIGEMYEFWMLKDEIVKTIDHSFNFITSSSDYDRAMKLLTKIESLGKKEQNGN